MLLSDLATDDAPVRKGTTSTHPGHSSTVKHSENSSDEAELVSSAIDEPKKVPRVPRSLQS